MTGNDQELASINRLSGNYAMVRNPLGVQNRYTNLSEIGKGEHTYQFLLNQHLHSLGHQVVKKVL